MSADRFTLDTNILVYAVDRAAGVRHDLAVEIVDRAVDRPCVLTVQALGEFVTAVTRKGLAPRAEAIAQAEDWLALFPVVAADGSALAVALAAMREGRFGFWDALLLATARAAGCRVALSEDMRDGAVLDGITVRNPLIGGAVPQDLRALLGMD